MKVPKSFEGCMVSMHLGRPVYAFEYGAHVKMLQREMLMATPVLKQVPGAEPGAPARIVPDLSEVIIGAYVTEVGEDSVTMKLFMPDADGKNGVMVRRCIPSALILNIEEVFEFEPDVPQMSKRQRAPAPRIIAP